MYVPIRQAILCVCVSPYNFYVYTLKLLLLLSCRV